MRDNPGSDTPNKQARWGMSPGQILLELDRCSTLRCRCELGRMDIGFLWTPDVRSMEMGQKTCWNSNRAQVCAKEASRSRPHKWQAIALIQKSLEIA